MRVKQSVPSLEGLVRKIVWFYRIATLCIGTVLYQEAFDVLVLSENGSVYPYPHMGDSIVVRRHGCEESCSNLDDHDESL